MMPMYRQPSYQKTRKTEELLRGRYDFDFVILDLGTHPTAYVKIPSGHPLYKASYEKGKTDCIIVHGGITYSRNYLYVSDTGKSDGWWIGWDYAHYGDHLGWEEGLPFSGHKWTTEEILKDVKSVCRQLKEMAV